MKSPTIIIEVSGGVIQRIGSTTKELNIIVVDHDHHESGSMEDIIQEVKDNISPRTPDIIKANHKMLVDEMFHECHDEIDQAVHDKLHEIGWLIEA